MTHTARTIVVAVACVVAFSGTALGGSQDVVRARVVVSPVVVSMAISPSSARAGTWVMARVTVRNLGPATIPKVSVRLRAPAAVIQRPTTAKVVHGLGPAASADVSWALCSRRPGAYLVFAEATVGGVVIDSPARLLTVTPGSATCTGGVRGHR